eukprot:g45831.t1
MIILILKLKERNFLRTVRKVSRALYQYQRIDAGGWTCKLCEYQNVGEDQSCLICRSSRLTGGRSKRASSDVAQRCATVTPHLQTLPARKSQACLATTSAPACSSLEHFLVYPPLFQWMDAWSPCSTSDGPHRAMRLWIDPELVPCDRGLQCMVVRSAAHGERQTLLGLIEGYEHTSGVEQVVRVEMLKVLDRTAAGPSDGLQTSYKLVAVEEEMPLWIHLSGDSHVRFLYWQLVDRLKASAQVVAPATDMQRRQSAFRHEEQYVRLEQLDLASVFGGSSPLADFAFDALVLTFSWQPYQQNLTAHLRRLRAISLLHSRSLSTKTWNATSGQKRAGLPWLALVGVGLWDLLYRVDDRIQAQEKTLDALFELSVPSSGVLSSVPHLLYKTTGGLHVSNLTGNRLLANQFRTENVSRDNLLLVLGWIQREQYLRSQGVLPPHPVPTRLLIDGFSPFLNVTDSFDGVHSDQASKRMVDSFLNFLSCVVFQLWGQRVPGASARKLTLPALHRPPADLQQLQTWFDATAE